jgi:hypothetical protein
VISVEEKATPKQHAALKKAVASAKMTLRKEVFSGKRINLINLKPLLQLLQLQSKRIILVKMMKMTRTKRLL